MQDAEVMYAFEQAERNRYAISERGTRETGNDSRFLFFMCSIDLLAVNELYTYTVDYRAGVTQRPFLRWNYSD